MEPTEDPDHLETHVEHNDDENDSELFRRQLMGCPGTDQRHGDARRCQAEPGPEMEIAQVW